MPRGLRIHVPGGFYHVTLRGNHRQPIFFSQADRNLLDAITAESIKRFAARVHAYCWMTNHVHLLMQVSDAPLGRIILRIASGYARSVQSRLATTGHLFERRFHAVLVDAEPYLLELIRYIHRNPVRAGLACNPGGYPWTSHHAYLSPSPGSVPWVTTATALRLFHPERDKAIEGYERFVTEGKDVRWGSGLLKPHPDDARILGDDQFVSQLLGSDWQPHSRQSLDDLIAAACQRFRITPESLAAPGHSRLHAQARARIGHQAVRGRIASVCEVARRLGRNESAIRQAMRRYPFSAE